MKFARLGAIGAETPAIMDGRTYYSLAGLTPDLDPDFWSSDGPARAAAALAAGELPELDAVNLRIGAPITRPSSVFCIGLNYAGHAAESGSEPPLAPILFQKAANTVSGPNDAVPIPIGSTKTDWEVELGVVIGTRASYLDSPSDALSHIAGFVAVNDLSERTFQLEASGGQWSKGKSCAGFCPTGPYLATPDEVDAGDLRLRSWVNGEPRQDSTTQDLIFDVATIIHDLSQYLVLEPGDLICTGTPEGVALSGRFPYLKAGDVVEVEVAGLGRQRQEFVMT
ncbi:fumarylacetoacetate hydrolase family protein [Pseudarthrobacter sp. H3Y2-7]|uniref:fumarylacetoacetate hydrolase family protein n=1 Tax=Pseudarthrobacter naphthalenicus TaxID=3031328 RepID=UPI0023B0E15C|nr:fumarylacetoacetate hydrolase family protein [Pseudarthrobacter sp. H3Y2-7]MDE8667736.1 fumarylacetoacetate hydrolase family protein [Pseudarthrobacter sp. H3Y2-7]